MYVTVYGRAWCIRVHTRTFFRCARGYTSVHACTPGLSINCNIYTVVAKINLISLQFATNVYYFYHTNANFLDPALIRGNTVVIVAVNNPG